MIRRLLISAALFSVLLLLAAGSPASAATLFAVDSINANFYRLDTQTAAATLIGPIGQRTGGPGLALEWRTGKVFASEIVHPKAIDGGGLGVVNTTTGAIQPVPGGWDYVFSLSVPGIAFAGDGTLLGASAINPGLVRLDPNTSVATIIAGWTGTKEVFGFASAPDGTLFGIDKTTLFRVNGTNGVLTPIGPHGISLTGNFQSLPLAFDPESGQLFSADGRTGRLFRINPASGAATLIGNTGIRPSGLVVVGASSIPTLGASGVLALSVLLGMVALVVMRRRTV
jgi:hypothetical protein